MGWMSPKQLNEDPKRWLDTPHESHEPLLEFMEVLYPGFKEKLRSSSVHCLECEGEKPFEVVTRDTLETKLCTGYIGEPGNVELLHLVDLVNAG